MEKNYYVNYLEKEDFIELYDRIRLYLDYKNQIIPVNYAIQTPTQRFCLENTKPYCTLFLRDFSCSLSNADNLVKENIKKIYRNFMLERFIGTSYEADATTYDEQKQAKTAL